MRRVAKTGCQRLDFPGRGTGAGGSAKGEA